MKKYSKILILFVLVAFSTQSFAQTFGIKGGVNFAKMLDKDEDETYSDDYKMKTGFHVGFTIEQPITDMFSFESGLLLSTKGFKWKEDKDNNVKLNLFYLDIPIALKTSFDLGGIQIYTLTGTYLGIGLSGKFKGEVNGNNEEADVDWGTDDDEDDFKRIDFGLLIGAGIDIGAIQIGLSYSLGLSNISTYTEDGYKNKNRVLSISVGYKFGGGGDDY